MRTSLYTICIAMLSGSLLSSGAVYKFRLDEDRIWLTADREPLPRLLEHFIRAGIRVEIDPAVQKTVSGAWAGSELSDVMDSVLSTSNYLLDWERETTPLGSTIRLTRIRIFPDGKPGSAKPLSAARKVDTSPDGSIRYIARELLIAFGPDASIDDLKRLLTRLGGTIIATHPDLGVYRILLPPGANIPALADTLGREADIAMAEPNYVYDLPDLLPGDPSETTTSRPWEAPAEPGTIAVSVLDSGLTLSDALGPAILSSFDATNPDTPLTTDTVGHGTTMAQLAAGLLDPYGSAVGEGVPVVAVKAFADDGMADSYTLMNAMTYAIANSDGPISLSWGSETPSAFLQNTINYAISKGALLFAAVGNKNTGIPMYPAACSGVIGVASGTGDGHYTDYSNQGDFVDIIIPGSAGGSAGTSVSTAAASYITALYMQHNPGISGMEAAHAVVAAAGPDLFLSFDEKQRLLKK